MQSIGRGGVCHNPGVLGITLVEVSMWVKELWRYPVKSLAGERLTSAMLGPDGIPGDRIVHVVGPEGVRTARRHDRLLGLHGTMGPEGPLVDGHAWNSSGALALVRQAAGNDARLAAWDGLERFDILPLLVATDGAVASFGRDVRRLRPNLVLGGVDGLAERSWEGARLQIGDAVLRLESLRSRCVMVTVDPDTLERDPDVLKDVGRRFGGRLALDTSVERGGLIRVGDEVRLLQAGAPGSVTEPGVHAV